jgi:hypothetical protein
MIAYVDDFMLMFDPGGDPADPAAAQAEHARRFRPGRRDGVRVRVSAGVFACAGGALAAPHPPALLVSYGACPTIRR